MNLLPTLQGVKLQTTKGVRLVGGILRGEEISSNLQVCYKVMKSFGGDIRFRSVQGGFAEFVLRFDVGK
jgi:hypothetical protein